LAYHQQALQRQRRLGFGNCHKAEFPKEPHDLSLKIEKGVFRCSSFAFLRVTQTLRSVHDEVLRAKESMRRAKEQDPIVFAQYFARQGISQKDRSPSGYLDLLCSLTVEKTISAILTIDNPVG
jgi:hypothetical protein